MSIIVFIKLLLRRWLWLSAIPVVTAVSVFYFLTLFNSRNTRQEVAFHLLARHLSLKDYDPNLQSWNTWVRLHELIDGPTRKKLVGATFEETVQNIANQYQANDNNVIYKLLNSEEQG